MLTRRRIETAINASNWDLGNKILYDLCENYPNHEDYQSIIAKIWIIGRSYAAAIERRKSDNVVLDEDFYSKKVAPRIYNSNIDELFNEIRSINKINNESIPIILRVHLRLTNLFNKISGLNKRSLASKYLHFHFPHLYFIYDSRAVKGLSKLKKYTGRASKSELEADNEYRKLFEKCLILQKEINNKYELNLKPRQIDNLLLSFANKKIKGVEKTGAENNIL